jgi:hypothetical protein
MPPNEKVIFRDYDILLPPKFDGGYLVISLYEKIDAGEINELFTVNDIRNCLQEISDVYGLGQRKLTGCSDCSATIFYASNPTSRANTILATTPGTWWS